MGSEPLTFKLIQELRQRAVLGGEIDVIADCDRALAGDPAARKSCAASLTHVRMMNNKLRFVRVIAE